MEDAKTGAAAIRIVLSDDHPFVLMGLRQLFDGADFDVVETCEDGLRTLAAVRKHRPDVLVLDLKMPGLDGFGVLRELQRENLGARSIVLTGSPDSVDPAQLVALGARGVMRKTEAPERLVECVRRIHAGGEWLEPSTAAVAQPRRDQLLAVLTQREVEIVDAVSQALPNKAIAQRLGIAEGTVKLHLHRIYDKLKLRGRMDLLLYVTERGAA